VGVQQESFEELSSPNRRIARMNKRNLIVCIAVFAVLVQVLAIRGFSTPLLSIQPQGDPSSTNVVGSGNRENIVINEIRYDDIGTDTENFVELKGQPELSLDGYTLVGVNGSNGSDYVVVDLSGYTIPADGYFVVGQSAAPYADLVDEGTNWQNGPDNIQLRMSAQVIDAVGYGDFSGAIFAGEGNPAPDCPAGMSLSRFPDGFDTDDNEVDFVVTEVPTPGFGSGDDPEPVINEVRYDDAGTDTENFAELKGPAGSSLNGYSLVGVNGFDGSDYVVIDLAGHTIPSDGYFVVGQSAAAYVDLVDAGANWQNGPDNIQLRIDVQVIDALGYGDFGSAIFAGEGDPAPECPAGMSLSRFPDGYDTDDNSVDFAVTEVPTPGFRNGPHPVINEVRYDDVGTDTDNFAELKGPPDLSLNGYSLVGVNGSDGSDYVVIDLAGHTIPSDGYFVVGQSAAAYVDLVDAGANWQNGPDNIQLRIDAQVIDALGYGDFSSAIFAGEGDPAPECPAGMSLSRFPDGCDTDDNSVDFLVSQTPTPGAGNEGYVCGDADASGGVDIDDVVYLIAYIFSEGPSPDPLESGDADCSGGVDIDDVVWLIAYIFSSGNAPCDVDGDEVPDC
jgi:hypothetical protein